MYALLAFFYYFPFLHRRRFAVRLLLHSSHITTLIQTVQVYAISFKRIQPDVASSSYPSNALTQYTHTALFGHFPNLQLFKSAGLYMECLGVYRL